MAEFFGVTTSDGRSEASMVDSIMMPILHSAMNRAHDKVRSSDASVLQRLAEQSKFCDLAVMQLDACVSCLLSADDDRGFQRQSTDYCNLVSDLTEIRDRLLGRLRETERAIADKDKELQRLRNWVRNQRSRDKEQVKEEKNILEERRKADLEREKVGVDISNKSKSVQDCDQIGSEINSLKKTLDVAMLVMQNAICVPDVRPFDLQFCWEMEKEIMTTLFAGFVRDFEFRLEEESVKSIEEWSLLGDSSLSVLMDDLLSLRCELESLAASIAEVEYKNVLLKNTEEVPKKESLRFKETNELQMCIQRLIKKLDVISAADKSLNHGKEISANQPTLECDKSRNEMSLRAEDTRELDLHVEIAEEIQSIVLRCMMTDFQQHMLYQAKGHETVNDVNKSTARNGDDIEELNLQLVITGEVQSILLRRVMKDFQHNLHDHELMSSIKEAVYKDLLRETIKNELIKPTDQMAYKWKNDMENCTADAFLKEELFEEVFKDCIRSKLSDLVIQSKELRTICNSLIASETQLYVESDVKDKVCTLLFKEMVNTVSTETGEFRIQDIIKKEVYQSTILDTLKDAYTLLKRDKSHNPDRFQDSVSIEKALVQSGTSKLLLKDFGSDQAAERSDGDNKRGSCNQKQTPSVHFSKEKKDHDVSLEETKGSNINNLSGFGFSLGEFCELISNSENALHQKLDINFIRLRRLKDQLLQSVGLAASLKRKETQFRQAFIRRCENLQKAETEVDILGDQVNALLNLVERIYATIQYHAPALQQCSGVLNILTLIKKELNRVMG